MLYKVYKLTTKSSNQFRYIPVGKTPNLDISDGNERLQDDWQPRSKIRKLFDQKKLTADNSEAISEFSQKFIVEDKYVKAYVDHLKTLDNVKNMRQKSRMIPGHNVKRGMCIVTTGPSLSRPANFHLWLSVILTSILFIQTGRLTRHGRMAGHWTTRFDSGYVQ